MGFCFYGVRSSLHAPEQSYAVVDGKFTWFIGHLVTRRHGHMAVVRWAQGAGLARPSLSVGRFRLRRGGAARRGAKRSASETKFRCRREISSRAGRVERRESKNANRWAPLRAVVRSPVRGPCGAAARVRRPDIAECQSTSLPVDCISFSAE